MPYTCPLTMLCSIPNKASLCGAGSSNTFEQSGNQATLTVKLDIDEAEAGSYPGSITAIIDDNPTESAVANFTLELNELCVPGSLEIETLSHPNGETTYYESKPLEFTAGAYFTLSIPDCTVKYACLVKSEDGNWINCSD